MRRARVAVLACVVMAFCVSANSMQDVKNINPGFDFSGIEEFLKVMDILKADNEPSEEQWQAMFETPGYAELIRREFKPDYFKKTMRAVYMPSRRSLAEELIQEDKQKGGFFAWSTPLVIEGFR